MKLFGWPLDRWARNLSASVESPGLLVPQDDGYWTPWWIAQERVDALEAELREVRAMLTGWGENAYVAPHPDGAETELGKALELRIQRAETLAEHVRACENSLGDVIASPQSRWASGTLKNVRDDLREVRESFQKSS